MARRIGTVGYYVMLPNLFYRDGGPSFDPALLATRGPDPEMDRLNRALSHSMVLSDTRALMDYAAADPAAREPIGDHWLLHGRASRLCRGGDVSDAHWRDGVIACRLPGHGCGGLRAPAHAPHRGFVLLRLCGPRSAHAPGTSARHRRCVSPERSGRGSRNLSRHRARIHVSHPPLLRQGVSRACLGTSLLAVRQTAPVKPGRLYQLGEERLRPRVAPRPRRTPSSAPRRRCGRRS